MEISYSLFLLNFALYWKILCYLFLGFVQSISDLINTVNSICAVQPSDKYRQMIECKENLSMFL